jgi:FxsC-like protein
LTNGPPATVGFMDRDVRPGENWAGRLSSALATCRVLVPLYSPRYFRSEHCGKEWSAFVSRTLNPTAQSDEPTEAIVPALWVGAGQLSLPEVARRVRLDYVTPGSLYSQAGFYGIMKLTRYRPEYLNAVSALARRIVDAANNTHIRPARDVQYSSLPSAFGSYDIIRQANRSMRITIAAPNATNLPEGRRASYYGATARDWNPYWPEAARPLADHAAALTQHLGYNPMISTFEEHISEENSRALLPSPGLLLVDAWATFSPELGEQLREFDELSQPWTNILVPWNHNDSETTAAEHDLKQKLRNAVGQLLSRIPPQYRLAADGIPTVEAFSDLLPLIAVASARQYLQRAPAYPPPGPVIERPRLSAVGLEDWGHGDG